MPRKDRVLLTIAGTKRSFTFICLGFQYYHHRILSRSDDEMGGSVDVFIECCDEGKQLVEKTQGNVKLLFCVVLSHIDSLN